MWFKCSGFEENLLEPSDLEVCIRQKLVWKHHVYFSYNTL